METTGARWPEIPAHPLVLVPLGSTEQHGPHLPLGTDTAVASAVARSAATELGAVLAPALPYGSSGEHQGFPGTASIGRDALDAVLTELVRSLGSWASRVVLVTGHGGNVPVLAGVVPRLREEGHAVGWIPCAAPGGDAHAGRTETSLLLHLDPAGVRADLAEAGSTRPIAELMPELRRVGVRAVAPNGVLGDPSGASADEGRSLLDGMVASSVRRIRADEVDASGMLRDPGASP